jgi:hypothetical protein
MLPITCVIGMNRGDCGAAEYVFGAISIAKRDAEPALHRCLFASFQAQFAQRQPKAASSTAIRATRRSAGRAAAALAIQSVMRVFLPATYRAGPGPRKRRHAPMACHPCRPGSARLRCTGKSGQNAKTRHQFPV